MPAQCILPRSVSTRKTRGSTPPQVGCCDNDHRRRLAQWNTAHPAFTTRKPYCSQRANPIVHNAQTFLFTQRRAAMYWTLRHENAIWAATQVMCKSLCVILSASLTSHTRSVRAALVSRGLVADCSRVRAAMNCEAAGCERSCSLAKCDALAQILRGRRQAVSLQLLL
jgi:hypothetical protein